jgi:putative addiction module CopG family antidote
MTVTLPADLQAFVDEQVAAGRSADEVFAEALRALQQKEQQEAKLSALRADIQVGVAELDAGKGVPGPFNARQVLEEIRRERGQQCGN